MNLRHKILIGSSVAVIVAAFCSSIAVGVYGQKSEHPFFRTVGGWLPVAKVDGSMISYREYLVHVDAQRAFLTGPLAVEAGAVKEITDVERKEAYERVIRIKSVEILARKAKQEITPLDVDRAYQELVARAGVSTTKAEIEGFLQAQFGWDEVEYKEHLLRPALIEQALRTKDEDGFEKTLQNQMDAASRYLRF